MCEHSSPSTAKSKLPGLTYTHLTRDERYQIAILAKAGHDQSEIADVMNRSVSDETIYNVRPSSTLSSALVIGRQIWSYIAGGLIIHQDEDPQKTRKDQKMLISHKKQFIYTKTLKTAGTSIESYFEKYCMPDGAWKFSHFIEQTVSDNGIVGYRGMTPQGNDWYNHMSADAIREKVGHDMWGKYFKFCVIRNPFDKVISGFHFFELSQYSSNPSNCYLEDFSLFERFQKWVISGGAERVIDRDKYLLDGKICIDFFIRHEELESGLKHVCQCLDVPFQPGELPQIKKSPRNRDLNIVSYYDQSSIDIVKNLFQFELDYFGYQVPK